ncbi:TIGR00645 family protein [Amaricoccus sp.]|uniref:TIGR00645 family protein n=1 Tax=Amaricoccus sp. TaxID=1872485 RepID=UPI0025BF1B40|nr:TIGR00645 family protein [Amaricoccus sp.]
MDPKRLERGLERGIFASRWLMAPLYAGLALSLLLLVVVFLREIVHFAGHALTLSDEEVVVAVLSLIDITLTANLVLIVLFAGYESFVSRLDIGEDADRPAWMGTIDYAGLKIKLIGAMVAISGIHLLKWFLWIGNADSGDEFQNKQVAWLVGIHLTFVVGGVLLSIMDWLYARSKSH